MDKSKLRQQATEMRQALLDEGILNNYFLQVETIEEDQPNFVENVIITFLSDSALCLDQLQEALEAKILDLEKVNCLIQSIQGGSASIGAGKFNAIVEKMCHAFKSKNRDRLYSTFMKVKIEYATMKLRLEPYAELLRLVREDVAVPDQESEIRDQDTKDQKDDESVDSNNTN